MEIPIHCPICHDVLVNDFLNERRREYCKKSCFKRVDHIFSCISYTPQDKIDIILVNVGTYRDLIICWDMMNRNTTVRRTTASQELSIPFIEIDLANIARAIDKVIVLLPFA